MLCYVCRGGFEDKVCTECGSQPKRSLNSIEVLESDLIPSYYKGKLWEKEILKTDNMDKIDNALFIKYYSVMEKITSDFSCGKIPQYSTFIVSTKKMSKTLFAYSCMQLALSNGFTVAPLLNTNQIDMKAEYMLSDFLVLSIPNFFDDRINSWKVILDVLDIRARLDLPTFIISNYSLNHIVTKSNKEYFFKMIDRSSKSDPLKYPRVLECIDETMLGGY